MPVAPPDEAPLPLRALRLTLGPRTVFADLGGTTVVRTTTRPTFPEGNALHLHEPPAPADLDQVLQRWDERFGGMPDIDHVRVRWVEPEDGRDLAPLADAAGARGLTLDVLDQWRFETLPDAAPLVDGTQIVVPDDDKRWHGVTVQYRHSGWPGDDALWRWKADGWRVLAAQGRGMTHLAVRWGVPVGVASLAWDPAAAVDDGYAGLAAIGDVLVHPAHRGTAVGQLLVHGLVDRLLRAHTAAQVVLVADPGPAGAVAGWTGFRRAAGIGGLSAGGSEGPPVPPARG